MESSNVEKQCDLHLAIHSINGKRTWSSMTPVYKLILPLDCLSQLRRPVAVLLLVHKKINALPHKLLICWLQVLIIGKQHLKDWWKPMCCTCKEQQQSKGEGRFRSYFHLMTTFSWDWFPCQVLFHLLYAYYNSAWNKAFWVHDTMVCYYFCLFQFPKLSKNT